MRHNSIFNLIEYMVDLINKVNDLLKIIIQSLIFKQPPKKIHGFKLHYIIISLLLKIMTYYSLD